MSYPTVKNITLDIYNNLIVCVNAKQSDANTRYIEVTCTEHSRKIVLDKNDVKACVRYTRPDGHVSLNDAEVLENGNVKIELTQQMLSVYGRCVADVMLLSLNAEIDMDKLIVYNDSVLSTMPFYINVLASSVDHDKVESTDEYNTLVNSIAKVVALDKALQNNETIRNQNETTRKTNEEDRQDKERIRQEKESDRQDKESIREQQEDIREQQEDIREQQEDIRKTTFETNETNRWQQFTLSQSQRATSFSKSQEERDETFSASQSQRDTDFIASQDDRTEQFSASQSQRNTDFIASQNERDEAFTASQNSRTEVFTESQSQRDTDFIASQNDRATSFSKSQEERDEAFTASQNSRTEQFNASQSQRSTDFNTSQEERRTSFETSMDAWGTNVNNAINRCNDTADEASQEETNRQTTFDSSMTTWSNEINDMTVAINKAENDRIEAENLRDKAEADRDSAEQERETNVLNIISECNTAIESADNATERANIAAEACENIIAGILYPIGSIYMSVNDINPSLLFGGTWEQIKDRFLLAAGDIYESGEEGGESEVSLSIDEMPEHNHSIASQVDTDSTNGESASMTNGTEHTIYYRLDDSKSTLNTGGSQPHNNMPPYLTVYMWQRTE